MCGDTICFALCSHVRHAIQKFPAIVSHSCLNYYTFSCFFRKCCCCFSCWCWCCYCLYLCWDSAFDMFTGCLAIQSPFLELSVKCWIRIGCYFSSSLIPLHYVDVYIHFGRFLCSLCPVTMCLGWFACVIPVAYMKTHFKHELNAKRHKMKSWRLSENLHRS